MELTTHTTQRALFVRLKGELDLHTAPRFKEGVAAALAASPLVTTLAVVLTDVTFIDSSGLGALIVLHRSLAERRKQLILVGPRPPVRRVLQFSGLPQLIDIVDSEAKALLRA